ncbi:MAG TPA: lytic transglycosylase domain-containing protein [Flavisolibacter sp.]|nr:lytic transglycosylase domain-containing protein [Flavisolibacter sp.]
MNKLLLLATSLISLLIRDFASATPRINPLNDTTATELVRLDQKNAFKDLFETDESTGINVSKLNPKAVNFVQDYMEDNTNKLLKMKEHSKPYFNLMSKILANRGLPVELKYLAVIESDLKTNAVSWAGAVGPWQIMPATARLLGLKVNGKIDERRDFTKSTYAAAKYLAELYDIFGDWLLVIAAYNGGPGKVNSAIKRSGSKNFWELQYHLPAESRNHVKKFIATQYIMEGDGGVTTLTKAETVKYGLSEDVNSDPSVSVVTISGKYHSQAIANGVQISLKEFQKLNPNFDSQLSSNGNYQLRLPNNKMDQFRLSKNDILEQSIRIMLNI